MMRPLLLSMSGRRVVQSLGNSDPTKQPFVKLFSVLNRPPPKYDGHVPLTNLEKAALGVGAAVGAFLNPYRADLVAATGEVTAGPFLERLRDTMLASETGRRILRDRPRITPKTMPLDMLRSLPENTVGRVYAAFCERYQFSPDGRDKVRYIDDEECAFVMQRYRECHDIYHAVLGLPPSFVEGEIALKAFEFVNTGLPMTALSLFAVARLKPQERDRFFRIYLPWALRSACRSKPLINVYWEEELSTDANVLLTRLGMERPPDMHDLRRKARK